MTSPSDKLPRNDVLGVIFFALAVLGLIALFSYDKGDLGINSAPGNPEVKNWIGSMGARSAYGLFLAFGAAAYWLPVLLLFIALGNLFSLLTYLRTRWLWGGLLFLSVMGFLDLHHAQFESLQTNLNIPSAGGIVGRMMNDLAFRHFGLVGATIIFLTVYFISLLYLTNFRLGAWLRDMYESFKARRELARERFSEQTIAEEEKALIRRAREIDKQSRKLARETGKPTPRPSVVDAEEIDTEEEEATGFVDESEEPTVRDNSIPRTRPNSRKNAAEDSPENGFDVEEVFKPDQFEPTPTPTPTPKPKRGKNPFALEESREEDSDLPDQTLVPTKAAPPLSPTREGDEDDSPLPKVTLSKPTARKAKPISVASTPTIGNYQLPPMDSLNVPDPVVKSTESKEELVANARLMQRTLAEFGIEVTLGDITKGPTITRYELHPAAGVRLERISALGNNISAALKAERINILAPVPGKSSVGVEVPNAVKSKVIMRDLLESEEWINSKARIPLALGKDVYGNPIIADLAEMPHLLIAGSTGSGKSVCINSIIASLLYKFSPDQLRFVMIDPKVVELQQYNALPHLVVPVVTDPKKVVLALRWVVNEMEKRYQIFAKVGVRNIKSFNDRPKTPPPPPPPTPSERPEGAEGSAEGFAVELDQEITVPREDDILIPEKLSYVVVIIDELADLMLVAPADVEMAIARITQMARAAGIHVIVATQRPSVDVITGVIKANIPARIAFQVAAKVDSRTILDAMGADKLLGKGDMLYLPPGAAKLTRAQGVLITDQEIQGVVDYIAKQAKPSYEMEIHQQLSKPGAGGSGESECDEDEELIQQCVDVIRSEQKASVSMMQRRLRLGYTRAARIMDELERRGIVGPGKGAEPRDILIDLDGDGADGRGQGLPD